MIVRYKLYYFVSIHQNNCIGHFDAILCNNYSNSVCALRMALATDFNTIIEQHDLFLANLQATQQAALVPIQATNSSFVTPVLHEELEKQVNDIYINTLEKGINDFDNNQLNTLRLIASYCPAEGGPAVHHAQALLSMTNDVDYLNFDCDNTQAKVGQPTEEESSILNEWTIKLFPNPTNAILNIQSNELLLKGSSIIIYNSIGQLIQQQTLDKELQFLQISTNELIDGIYFIEIKHQEKVYQQAFSVIKN